MVDLDQGGVPRIFQRQYLGPSIGWVPSPSDDSTQTITANGSYLIDRSIRYMPVDTTTATSVSITLPPAADPVIPAIAMPPPFVNSFIIISDIGGNSGAFPIVIHAQAGESINGSATISISTAYGSVILVPNPTRKLWSTALPITVPPYGRTILPAFSTKNVYISPTGNDSTGDGTIGNPWQTLFQAWYHSVSSYDGGSQNTTLQINLANGTYNNGNGNSGLYMGANYVGFQNVSFVGNSGSPSSVIYDGIGVTNGTGFYLSGNTGGLNVSVSGVQCQNWSQSAFNNQSNSCTFTPQNIIFTGNNLCFEVEGGGLLECQGPLTFSGTNGQAIYCNGSFCDTNDSLITFSPGANFSFAVLNVDNGGIITWYNNISGTCTGTQFFISNGSVIHAVGSTYSSPPIQPTAMPGNANTGYILAGVFNSLTGVGYNTAGGGGVGNISGSGLVSNLPTTTTYGVRSFVNDATATTFYTAVVGGGTNSVPVWFDGTTWRIG
jgi:hypothetical protein